MSFNKKIDYAKSLAERIKQMHEENFIEKQKFNAVVHKKVFGGELSNEEYQIYFRCGAKYPKSVINAFRLKLNKVLCELWQTNVLQKELGI